LVSSLKGDTAVRRLHDPVAVERREARGAFKDHVEGREPWSERTFREMFVGALNVAPWSVEYAK